MLAFRLLCLFIFTLGVAVVMTAGDVFSLFATVMILMVLAQLLIQASRIILKIGKSPSP
jgi:hypothetical protein